MQNMKYLRTSNVAIKKGKNWFTKARLRKFNPSYVYHLEKAPMIESEHVNKAVGISSHLTVHKNSIRVGWRRDNELIIHWYVYSYINGERYIKEIEWLKGQEEMLVSFQIKPTDPIPPKEYGLERYGSFFNKSKGDIQRPTHTREYPMYLVMEVPDQPLLKQYIQLITKPKWMTNFYWGGDPYEYENDTYWFKSNIPANPALVSMYKTAMSSFPLVTAVGTILAIFVAIYLLFLVSIELAVGSIILGFATFLIYVLRNFINYEKWITRKKVSLFNRIRKLTGMI